MNGKTINRFFLTLQVIILITYVNLVLGRINFQKLVICLRPADFRVENNSNELRDKIFSFVYKVLYTSLFGYLIFRPTCLKKSLVLYRIFRLYGFPVELNIGVKKVHGNLEAHSWISYRKLPIYEKDDILSEYELLYSYA
ncbi:MAG: lasso peptide biosynthesis B2 protein [bacterium]|nr:lasso peptide biosynthesis B2 protein [bacterium]